MPEKVNHTPNVELLDTLAELTGAFGLRGSPEAKVVLPNGYDVKTLALTEPAARAVKNARELLTRYGRTPIRP